MMQPGLISILCWEEKSIDDATVMDSWHNELDEYMPFSCIISVIVASSATRAGTEDQGIWSQKYARELHMDVAVSISLLARDHQWPGSFSSGASCFTVSSASGTGRRNWKGDS